MQLLQYAKKPLFFYVLAEIVVLWSTTVQRCIQCIGRGSGALCLMLIRRFSNRGAVWIEERFEYKRGQKFENVNRSAVWILIIGTQKKRHILLHILWNSWPYQCLLKFVPVQKPHFWLKNRLFLTPNGVQIFQKIYRSAFRLEARAKSQKNKQKRVFYLRIYG